MGWKRISLEQMFLLSKVGVPCTIAEVRTRHTKPGHKRKPNWHHLDTTYLRPLPDCQVVMVDKEKAGWTFLFSVETE